jgi:hypothetical protein
MPYPTILPFAAAVLEEISHERGRQINKHGNQSHLPDGTGDDRHLTRNTGLPTYGTLAHVATAATDAASEGAGNGTVTFADILVEEVFEALAESNADRLRAELIQTAAVCVQWVQAIDGREVTR